MGLSDLIARTKSSYNNEFPSTGWKPIDPLPAGFSRSTHEYNLPLSSFHSLEINAEGSWAKGTMEFVRAEQNGELQDAADDAYGKVGGRVCQMKVEVEARSNSEQLLGGWKIKENVMDHRVGLELKTGDSSPLAAHLSFHFTFHLPASLTGLNSLSITTDRFRLLFHPSLASNLSIASLSLTTTDAPISLHLTQAGEVHIRNQCILDPSKGKSIKTTDDLISGSISAERIKLECQHGAISGDYTSTVGPLVVSTTNFPITGSYTAQTTLHLSTTNNSLVGAFVAHALPSQLATGVPGILIDTAQGRVEGTFFAPAGIKVHTKNAPISGEFTVAGGGEGVTLRTSYFKIDAKVKLLSPVGLVQGGAVGQGQRQGRRGSEGSSLLGPGLSPTASLMTYSEPPSFDFAMNGAGSGGAGAGRKNKVSVEAETTDGMVVLEYLAHPSDVVLKSDASTSGGAKVVVKHLEGWQGTFAASTILANAVSLDIPHMLSPSASTKVEYTTKKRWDIAGTVGVAGGNSTKARGTGQVEIIIGA